MDMMDKILYSYKNGNTTVTIYEDGTKVREFEDTPQIDFMESMDVKITNYCDLNCSFCHEMSTTKGKHCDVDTLIEVLDNANLPKGIELALGGGDPISHPELPELLTKLYNRGFICNLTVNQQHLKKHKDLLIELLNNNLIKGLGISINNNDFTVISELMTYTNNIVFHLIAGVNNINIIDSLMILPYCKVLILGYKYYGRGVKYQDAHSKEVTETLQEWFTLLPKYLGKCTLSFDNLAIEQLNVRRLFTEEGWKMFYMGDDFTFTMYIDAVEEMYAPTSRDGNKVSFKEKSLLEYFKGN